MIGFDAKSAAANLDQFDLEAMREGSFIKRHTKSFAAPVKKAQRMARDPKSRQDRSRMVTIRSKAK